MGNRLYALLTAAAVAFCGLHPAAAQTNLFPQTLAPSTVVGRTGIGPGPAQAIPFSLFTGLLTAGPTTWSGTVTTLPAQTISGVYQALLASTTNPTTVSGAPAELDHFRCSQAGGLANQYVIGGTGSVVTCFEFNLQANAGSVASSNLYGAIGLVTNLGAGTVSGLYGRAVMGPGGTGAAIGVKSGAGCATTAAACYGYQQTDDTFTNGGTLDAAFWITTNVPGQTVNAHYGLLFDANFSVDHALLQGVANGAGNFLTWQNIGQTINLYQVDVAGRPIQCGSSSGCITFQAQAAAGTYNWNWPVTAGLNGSILLSQAGGATPMVWLNDVAAGQYLVSEGVGVNPSYEVPARVRRCVTGVNFNAANTDTALALAPVPTTRWVVDAIRITNASASISTATVGAFTATGGGGAALAANQAITVTSASADANNSTQALTLTNQNTEAYNDTTVQVRVGTAQGSAATADVCLYMVPLT